MAHFVGRLTALKVMKVKKPGLYADGAGLYSVDRNVLEISRAFSICCESKGFPLARE